MTQPGLFDLEQFVARGLSAQRDVDAKLAEARRDVGIARADAHSQRVAPAWRDQALAAVRAIALDRATFLAEEVRSFCSTPDEVDPKSWGPIMQQAKRLGWIHPQGYAPANSSNRSPKVLWKSLLLGFRP